ncbi:hypothetical protein BU16DRAFT_185832 [Lophium mytilinum]|uniref:Uncharacterized protein n=1 Tax=Lophium mytilinum TaxID=390894 RepID=A0A6A6R800_9PEZI|nr:hypothetical protein BU16DRAFT_185832 [Lophium mytilinum]
MFCRTQPNCTNYPHHCPPPNPNGDGLPDVAGIGVVWSFGITAILTVLFAMPITLLSLLDILLCLRRALHLTTDDEITRFKTRLHALVEHITLGLSDQQLITGLTILTIGWTRHCTISSRHFWIVFDLSFFSAVTHLASLLALRSYFSQHRRLRDFRVFLMLCNYVMLLVAAILSFRDYDESTRDCPIQCAFDRIRSRQLGVSAMYTVQMVLLSVVFFWQLGMMYVKEDAWGMRHDMILRAVKARGQMEGGEQPARTYRGLLRARKERLEALTARPAGVERVTNVLKIRWVRKRVYTWLWRVEERFGARDGRPGRKSYEVAQWTVLMMVAPPAAVVWLVILTLLAMGVGRLVLDRRWAVGAENKWTFGQVLPMLIVVLPFFTLTEELRGVYSKLQRQHIRCNYVELALT